MLEIKDLTYRIAGRTLLDGASAFIASGWKVGLVGRNGTGKSTLVRLIEEARHGGDGSIRLAKGARLGFVAQELPATDTPLMQMVLDADEERAALLAEADTATDPERIADIHMRLADIDAHSAEARAAAILTGLGFAQEALARPSREFSGGWRMRAALAGVLFSAPELLVLDEPTNYLDLEGAAWLEGFLRRFPNTALIVSHDRELLNRSVTHILALHEAKLEVFPGTYDGYVRKRAERAAGAAAMRAKQEAERAHLQAFVDRFRAKASKAAQAQSRIKRLEKMQIVDLPLSERTIPFTFEDPGELADPVLRLEHADIGYAPGRPVLKDVSLRVDHDDRIAIIGTNGQGKTTLVRALGARLDLFAGKRFAAKGLRVGYFSQDQLEDLEAGRTVLEHVQEAAPDLPQARQRALAASFGFGAQKVDTRVERLSGGEKVRLLMGLTAYRKPHVLILDEPTSHLDIDSRDALIAAINEFPGAVLLITHDVHLAQSCADRLWLVRGGRAAPYEGDLDAYRALLSAADRPGDAKAAARFESVAAPPPAPRRAPVSKRKLADLEAAVARAQAALDALDRDLADPSLFTADANRGAALAAKRDELVQALAEAEDAWLEASEAAEA